MNEEIEKMIQTIIELNEIYKAQPTYETAIELEMELTKMKLTIGIQRFDELPSFTRMLRTVSKFINEKENGK